MSNRQDSQEAMLNDWVRPLIVEFLGPFALTFAGAGAIIATGGHDLVAIALAHGLAIGLFVLAAGHISGGLYNPAVTVGLMFAKKLAPVKGLAYIVVQLLGATTAAAVLTLVYRHAQWGPVHLGTPLVNHAADFNNGQAIVVEAIMTFFLMFVIFGTAVDHRTPKSIAGLAIGLTITMDIFAGGAISGAAMNPSRAFGPALISNTWDDHWVYWLAPMAGAIIAAGLYAYVLLTPETPAHAGHAPE